MNRWAMRRRAAGNPGRHRAWSRAAGLGALAATGCLLIGGGGCGGGGDGDGDPKPENRAATTTADPAGATSASGSGSGSAASPAPAPAAEPPPAPWFELVTDSGIDFVHDSGERGDYLMMASLCGGAALFDADGDGDLDAYLVQAGVVGEPASRRPNRLYRNDGDWRFTDITEASGTGDPGYGLGVACGDFDGDGDVDLYVTNFGPNVLYRNDGDGTFTDVTAAAGVGDPGFSTGAAFVDVDGDGHLDLWVVNYIEWRDGFNDRTCYNLLGDPDYCTPIAYDAPAADRLYRNRGDGTFEDISSDAGLPTAPGTGLGILVTDLDDDGRVDVFIANDTMEDRLWINRGGGRFEETGLLSGVAANGQGQATASMGVWAHDFDFDGDLDVIVGNIAKESDSVFRNDGGSFTDISNRTGLAATSPTHTRFGLAWQDFDHDGIADLYHANGRVMRQEQSFDAADPYAEPNVLFRGTPEGRFVEVQPKGGTDRSLVATSRGAAFGDLDGDGDLDMLIVNRDGPAHLLRNVAPRRGGWLMIDLREPDGRLASHATVTARVGDRSVRMDPDPAASYFASNDPRAHLGLGAATAASDVVVRWADGSRESFGDLPAGAVHRLVRGTGTPLGSD